MKPWTQAEAIALCGQVEMLAPKFGCHVALTGGTLYKIGERKDVDLLFYRIRQKSAVDRKGLLAALESHLEIKPVAFKGWVVKARLGGRDLDLFFPEGEEVWDGSAGADYA